MRKSLCRLLPALLALTPVLLALTLGSARADNVVVIAHPGLGKLNALTIQRIFTGKTIEVGGVPVVAVNLKPCPLRDSFLQRYLHQDEDKYIAYWTVRQFIGKGTPPRELPTTADLIRFVQATPGAIGYIDDAEVKPELNVVNP
jgi:hypothetical protein